MKKWSFLVLAFGLLSSLSAQDTPPAPGGAGGAGSGGGAAAGGEATPPGGGSGRPKGPTGDSIFTKDVGQIIKKEPLPESVWAPTPGDAPLANGIRFTFKEVPPDCQGGLYMVLNKERCAKVDPIMGLVGSRLPLPASRVVTLYDKPLDKGKPQGKKILTAQVPSGLSGKVIGVFVGSQGGGYDLFFVDEGKLEGGTTYIRNLTNETLGLQIGKDKLMTLKPGDSELFAPGFSAEGKNSYSGKMYRQEEGGKWYVSRQFSLISRKEVAGMALLVWNQGIDKPDLQKVDIANENYSRERAQQNAARRASAAGRAPAAAAPAAGN